MGGVIDLQVAHCTVNGPVEHMTVDLAILANGKLPYNIQKAVAIRKPGTLSDCARGYPWRVWRKRKA